MKLTHLYLRGNALHPLGVVGRDQPRHRLARPLDLPPPTDVSYGAHTLGADTYKLTPEAALAETPPRPDNPTLHRGKS